MNYDLTYLTIGLPEDILKLKWNGDFETMKQVIHMKLHKNLSKPLKKRLELELEIIKTLPSFYPWSFEEAYEIMSKRVANYTREELHQARLEDKADWIFIQGEVRFRRNFYSNIIKTDDKIGKRLFDPDFLSLSVLNQQLLDETITRMKSDGTLRYYYRIRTSIQIEKEYERIGDMVLVHIPIPLEYAQVKNVTIHGTSIPSYTLSDKTYPQRTLSFYVPLEENRVFWVEYSFEIEANYIELHPEQVVNNDYEGHLDELMPHIQFTPYLKMLAKEIVEEETNPLLKARSIYNYITQNVNYSFMRSYFTITNLTEYAALGLKADCGIQALLFITLCRIVGVPARWQAGLYVTPHEIGNHDWAQFYVAPYGWLYCDCSFGGSAYRSGNLERWNFYFGNLDPYRMPSNSEFQYEFQPPKQHLRFDPYDSQDGEVEYNDIGLTCGEYETYHEVINCTCL